MEYIIWVPQSEHNQTPRKTRTTRWLVAIPTRLKLIFGPPPMHSMRFPARLNQYTSSISSDSPGSEEPAWYTWYYQ